ncbi:MAG: pentapeptide repeat-containing protein, partial [Candidatus Aminicenantes bacterium]
AKSEPDPQPDPKIILDHIAEVSKNARAAWFGLLGLLAFVGVTLLGHQDADFFAYGAETQLPLVGLKVPVKSFFYVAPVLVAALYIHLHLYLMTLSDALGELEQKKGAAPIADRVFPWLISHAALWYRNRARNDKSAAPRPLGWVVVIVSLLFGWLFGLAVLGGLWLRSMPAHDQRLTLWIGLCLWIATLIGLTGVMAARARMQGEPRETVAGAHMGRQSVGSVMAVLLAFVSWEATEGGFLTYTKTGAQVVPLLYSADLREAELTRKPSGWLPWHLWLEDFEEKFRKRKNIAPDHHLTGKDEAAFKKEAKERYAAYISQLDAPSLQYSDLRNADLTSAFLPGADLRSARLQGAIFREARMQGASLNVANMDGAVFRRAEMQGAIFRKASMRGTNLSKANMQWANLFEAQLQAADFFEADLEDADCSAANLQGAVLRSAKVTCEGLSKKNLKGAVGDRQTTLRGQLTLVSCLKMLADDVAAALLHHREEGDNFHDSRSPRSPRAWVSDALLCDRNKDDSLVEWPRWIEIQAPPEQ